MNTESLRERLIQFTIERDWRHLIAKHRDFQQSLFEHAVNEVDTLIALFPILGRPNHYGLTDTEKTILLVSALGHDIGKERSGFQDYILGKSRDWVPDIDLDYTSQILPQLCDLTGTTELMSDIRACINLHMKYSRTDANIVNEILDHAPIAPDGHDQSRWATLAAIIDAVDNFCSSNGLLSALSTLENSVLASHLKVSYHLLRVRGVSTPFLHRAAEEQFRENGWHPLLHFGNGTIYVCGAEKDISIPTKEGIQSRLTHVIAEAMRGRVSPSLIIGSPTGNILPKPELFDHRELPRYLAAAAKRVGIQTFRRKKEEDRWKVVEKYFELIGDDREVTLEVLTTESERISLAYPEMLIFKFFKAAVHPKFIGEEASQIVAEGYDKFFGQGRWEQLLATANLMAAKDMANTVRHYWSLPGEKIGINAATVEEIEDKVRREHLARILNDIAQKAYASMEEPPNRDSTAKLMASTFVQDLYSPGTQETSIDDVKEQLEHYSASKPFCGRVTKKARYLCPICNAPFNDGKKASADFLDNPESFTNRAPAQGSFGYVMICEGCYYERALTQILVGGKYLEMIYLFPRMNLGPRGGAILLDKVRKLREHALIIMQGRTDTPDRRFSTAFTPGIARNMGGRDLSSLSPKELAEILSYIPSENKRKEYRRELKKKVKTEFGDDIEELNKAFVVNYGNFDDFIEGIVKGEIDDDDLRDLFHESFKHYVSLDIVCETPNTILIPMHYPFKMGDESESNIALRKLFTGLFLGLALGTTCAVVESSVPPDVLGGEGVAHVPRVPAVRNILKTEWVSIIDAKKWLKAIGSASILCDATAYPPRSNLYSILTAQTPGHILRRIEEKQSGNVSYDQLRHIEKIKEVLR